MEIKNKEQFLFYVFLIILVVTRIIGIINTYRMLAIEEARNLFVSSAIANGVFPSPFIFQERIRQAGGGGFIYSLIAVPFMLLFGKSFFALRLASIVFLVLMYILLFRFCNRYFGLKVAVFASLLFIVIPKPLTDLSIAGYGRHFHLNLFFILSLSLFAKIKEENKILYYLLFGLVCGLGVYFYPAFLVTVFVYGLFLFWDIDLRDLSFVYTYPLVFIWVIIAGNYIYFGEPWYSVFFTLLQRAPKNVVPSGSIFSIFNRFVINFFGSISQFLAPHDNRYYFFSLNQFLKFLFSNLTTFTESYLIIICFIFIFTFLSLAWLNRRYMKKFIYNSTFFYPREKQNIPVSKYITIFLLIHICIYNILFSLNQSGAGSLRYYVPLWLNVLLIMAVFLDEVRQKVRYIAPSLLLFILWPAIIFQFDNLKTTSLRDFYKHYVYFYYNCGNDYFISEIAFNKPISLQKLICDRLDINICYSIGAHYCYLGYFEDAKNLGIINDTGRNSIRKHFEYLSSGDMNKLRYLYQGYIVKYFCCFVQDSIKDRPPDYSVDNIKKFTSIIKNIDQKYSIDNIKIFTSIIENIDQKYRGFCYIGLGEGFFTLVKRSLSAINKKIIEEAASFIKEDYKKYFFQGLGEGLAKTEYAVAYSPYIKGQSMDYDQEILKNYLNMLGKKEYRDAFLAGFFNQDIWRRY